MFQQLLSRLWHRKAEKTSPPSPLAEQFVEAEQPQPTKFSPLDKIQSYLTCRPIFHTASLPPLKPLRPLTVSDLSIKEQKFLTDRGITKEWKRVSGSYPVAQWLFMAFQSNDDSFEHLSAALIREQLLADVAITAKATNRTDGGFDAIGICPIKGNDEPIGVQVKLHNPSSTWVDDSECDRFTGALFKRGLKHGLFISTGIMTPRFIQSIGAVQTHGINIYAWDRQNIENLFTSGAGYGVCNTGISPRYIHESFLADRAQPDENFLPRNGFLENIAP